MKHVTSLSSSFIKSLTILFATDIIWIEGHICIKNLLKKCSYLIHQVIIKVIQARVRRIIYHMRDITQGILYSRTIQDYIRIALKRNIVMKICK